MAPRSGRPPEVSASCRACVECSELFVKTPVKATLIAIAVAVVLVLAAIIYALVSRGEPSSPAGDAEVASVVRPDSHVVDDGGDGSVVVVEFLDFECEACGAFYPIVEDLREQFDGEITYIVRYFPLPGHTNSTNAALAAEAAAMIPLRTSIPDAAPMAKRARDFIELFQHVLEGRAAMISGDHPAAIAAFGRAAAIQAQDTEGGDPPIVWYPTRRSLAAAMLASGDAAGAKAKIEELLKDWPSDPYSYFVLAQAETALGNTAAATEARRQSQIEWLGGEMRLALT